MYQQYFGLSEAPFAITPDPAFVFLSQRHRDALAHLLYGIGQGGSGGFVQLTGEVGTGKTTLCRCLLEQVPEGTKIALVLNPLMTPIELLAAICEELEISTAGIDSSSKALVDSLNEYLLWAHRSGQRVVVVIDEAQNLSPEALEQVRLLTNLETSKEKLLQIVLLGQPELRELLQRRSLRQLAQRITARYHLTPLSPGDTALYVKHRMQVAGSLRNPFKRSALRALYQRSHGVPRLINIIADRALIGAYASERLDIDARLINAAADEVQLGEPGARRSHWSWLAATASGLLLAAATYVFLGPGELPWLAIRPAESAAMTPQDSEPQKVPPVALPEPVVEPEPELKPEPTVTVPSTVLPASLDAQWLETQHRAAWQGLAALWSDPEGGDQLEAACNGAEGTSYACLAENGNWARIRSIGLPVVLLLHGEKPRLLLLQGMDDSSLLVGAPATTVSVDRAAVDERWLGAYYVAWPQAPNWPREIARGASGPAVDTIIRLAGMAARPYVGEATFGPAFESWLVAFQARHGLMADGIVGPRTLLYLLRASVTEPVLLSAWDKEI